MASIGEVEIQVQQHFGNIGARLIGHGKLGHSKGHVHFGSVTFGFTVPGHAELLGPFRQIDRHLQRRWIQC